MKFTRMSGIMMHVTSLPGPYGIGDLGPSAYRWVDFLSESGCGLWQILPLNPTGYGDSPYQSFSAFAGNVYLISPELLVKDGMLSVADLEDHPIFDETSVDYGAVIPWKIGILRKAFLNVNWEKSSAQAQEFDNFQIQNRHWIEDFVIFMAIKASQDGATWDYWPEELRMHRADALETIKTEMGEEIHFYQFCQFLFDTQWHQLKQYANEKGVLIVGDLPLYVGYDSADAWSHPELYYFDEDHMPTHVAGVPPDYFSPTGQVWGNPVYDWKVHQETGFKWWIERIERNLRLFDFIRIDHFRGLAGFWLIPAESYTAEIGRWIQGPGAQFFDAIRAKLGDLPLIAEDLGEITPDVIELRDQVGLPGMKILQFAFSTDANDPFLPHNHISHCVVYTGTFDNDTIAGWFASAYTQEREFCLAYLNTNGEKISWDMIRAAWASVAQWALTPLQDLLELGSDARMNLPGRPGGSWTWRFEANALDDALKARLVQINRLYGRSSQ